MLRGFHTALAAAVAALALLVVPASAGAAQSGYTPDADSQSFFTSKGGWTASTDAQGLCVTMLTCPEVTNWRRPKGGTFGASDGHLRTAIATLTGVGSESFGIWQSPAFNYQGVNGREPATVGFTITRRSNLEALLSVAGNSADTSVDLVDLTAGGDGTRIIDALPIVAIQSWTRVPVVDINPDDLVIGHHYAIRIVSRFAYGSEVIPGGSVDYDDVLLFASTRDGDGDGGDDDFGVGDIIGGGQNVFFDGSHLFFKLKCHGLSKKGKCKVRATALTKKKGGKRITFPIQRKVKAKKGKIVKARVRDRFRDKLERKKKILIRSKVHTGPRKNPDKEKLKFKKRKLIQRGA